MEKGRGKLDVMFFEMFPAAYAQLFQIYSLSKVHSVKVSELVAVSYSNIIIVKAAFLCPNHFRVLQSLTWAAIIAASCIGACMKDVLTTGLALIIT